MSIVGAATLCRVLGLSGVWTFRVEGFNNRLILQVRCEWSLSPAEESLLTSVVFLGTIVGSFLWGALSDAKGRRLGFASTAGCIFLFGVASALAPSYAVRRLFRSQ